MKQFFEKLKYRFATFMQGRYGSDDLNKGLCIAAIVFIVLEWFTLTGIFAAVAWALIFVSFFRMFSRNYAKRSAANQAYLRFMQKPKRAVRNASLRWKNRKTTVYFKCKSCGTMLSVPKGKGKLRVVCPKCKTEHYRKS